MLQKTPALEDLLLNMGMEFLIDLCNWKAHFFMQEFSENIVSIND